MVVFYEEKCCKCGEKFGLSAETYTVLRRSGKTFYCPHGHGQVYSKTPIETEAAAIRRERDRLKQDAARLEDQIRCERELREAAERRVSAARGQVTRLKNRAAAGLCPCCNRSFENLQRHMKTKHAGFMAEEVQSQAGVVH